MAELMARTHDSSKQSSDQKIQDLLARRQFAQAETVIRTKLKENPHSADHHYFLGVTHYFQGNLPSTVESLKRALSIDPRHTDAAVCLSVLFNDVGKYEDAKKVFEQANQSVAHKRTGADSAIDRK